MKLLLQDYSVFATYGKSWNQLYQAALGNWGTAKISDQDSNHDVYTLAGALVSSRLEDDSLQSKTEKAIQAAIGTEVGGRTLALGRNLLSYVLAADAIQLGKINPTLDSSFKSWLSKVRTENLSGLTLIKTHETRPNNWGTMCGASRIAADIYIGDKVDLDQAARVFRGWLGDRTAYKGFSFGDTSWQCDVANPVGINPTCIKSGHNIGGSLPDDMRRGCSFKWLPCHTNYPWGALVGAVMQAELLYSVGYGSYYWSDKAIKRAVQFLYDLGSIDSFWWQNNNPLIWIVNKRYGLAFSTTATSKFDKNIGWTDWLYQ